MKKIITMLTSENTRSDNEYNVEKDDDDGAGVGQHNTG